MTWVLFKLGAFRKGGTFLTLTKDFAKGECSEKQAFPDSANDNTVCQQGYRNRLPTRDRNSKFDLQKKPMWMH